ncbi:MAG: acyl carrier protein [Anaerovoracaceae bacterium]
MTFEKLAERIAGHIGIAVEDITQDTKFEDLGIDSLDTVEILMDIEEELGIQLVLDEKLETVGQFHQFIESKLA